LGGIVLVCFWSPKGGSGTSVVAAASALVLARTESVRLADLTGDQPPVLGMADDPEPGLFDWLRAGPDAPTEALAHLAVTVAPNLALLPAGNVGFDGVLPEAGAALAVALGDDTRTTMCDAGRLDHPALCALAEVADVNVVVVRGCYLALRRAVHHPAIELATGVVLVDEHGRSLGTRDVEDVLGLPVVATIEARGSTARAVDAGVLITRMPERLARPLRHALARIGCIDTERAA
jgi:hypothetical protein